MSDAVDQAARPDRPCDQAAVFVAIGLLRLPLPAVLLVATHSASPSPFSSAGGLPHEFRHQPNLSLALTFRGDVAVCGGRANAAIPEMHRVASMFSTG